MTMVSLLQPPQMHCSGVQATIFSMRSRCAGSVCRPDACALAYVCSDLRVSQVARREARAGSRPRLLAADAWLKLKQIQLKIAELLAGLAILGDAHLAQPLFKNLDLQLRIGKFTRIRLPLLLLCMKLLCCVYRVAAASVRRFRQRWGR